MIKTIIKNNQFVIYRLKSYFFLICFSSFLISKIISDWSQLIYLNSQYTFFYKFLFKNSYLIVGGLFIFFIMSWQKSFYTVFIEPEINTNRLSIDGSNYTKLILFYYILFVFLYYAFFYSYSHLILIRMKEI